MKKIFLTSVLAIMLSAPAIAGPEIHSAFNVCPAGQYMEPVSAQCTDCPEGSTSDEGATDFDTGCVNMYSYDSDEYKNCIINNVCYPVAPDVSATTDIASSASSANCNDNTLGTTSGTSNLEAKWTANTLNLKWYDDVDGNEITPTNSAAATCTYDSGITVPSNPISKTGYTFAGWAVRQAAQKACNEINDVEECNAMSNCEYHSYSNICAVIVSGTKCSAMKTYEDCEGKSIEIDPAQSGTHCHWVGSGCMIVVGSHNIG